MAKRKKASWAERRWKLFRREYDSNPELEEALSKIKLTIKDSVFNFNKELAQIMFTLDRFGVPSVCMLSAALFMINPDLPEKNYIDEVIPPFILWSPIANIARFGSHQHVSRARFLKNKMEEAQDKGVLNFDTDNINYEELAVALFGNPMIEILPGVKKSELIEFVNEYWDYIEKELVFTQDIDDFSFKPALTGKVQPPKLKKVGDRDALIMKLHKEGKNDKQIATYLIENTKYTKLDPEYIRVIRNRNKHKTI